MIKIGGDIFNIINTVYQKIKIQIKEKRCNVMRKFLNRCL